MQRNISRSVFTHTDHLLPRTFQSKHTLSCGNIFGSMYGVFFFCIIVSCMGFIPSQAPNSILLLFLPWARNTRESSESSHKLNMSEWTLFPENTCTSSFEGSSMVRVRRRCIYNPMERFSSSSTRTSRDACVRYMLASRVRRLTLQKMWPSCECVPDGCRLSRFAYLV